MSGYESEAEVKCVLHHFLIVYFSEAATKVIGEVTHISTTSPRRTVSGNYADLYASEDSV